ncbi:hypothetical protein HPB49_011593 [Dermacentor silvarum]|uniref:Uncharacterized protein n=1 Tax=Dermacentor silvarum TaxID=543639 RepID=A0ACB8D582_DERSI|nr:hypothetical protein HPB49_011593 [Dermacentor silvarum]
MSVQLMGDISPDEITEEAGWKTAGARRSRPRNRWENLTHDIDARTDNLGTSQQGTKPKYIKGKVIKAGRMPRLPKDEIKIVVRPQGGLDLVKVRAPTVTTAIFAAAGGKAVGVPGELRGYDALLSKFGNLKLLKHHFNYTIDLAKRGILVSQCLADAVREKQENIKSSPELNSCRPTHPLARFVLAASRLRLLCFADRRADADTCPPDKVACLQCPNGSPCLPYRFS